MERMTKEEARNNAIIIDEAFKAVGIEDGLKLLYNAAYIAAQFTLRDNHLGEQMVQELMKIDSEGYDSSEEAFEESVLAINNDIGAIYDKYVALWQDTYGEVFEEPKDDFVQEFLN